MRIALIVHAFPPHSCTGVEVYCEALARALGRRGHEVAVLSPRADESRAYLTQQRVQRDGYSVTWLSLDSQCDDESRRRVAPGADRALARFVAREQPDVVHFQHLLRFGPAALDVAREGGRPTLFTAHDAFAFRDEYTLLAPDLSPTDPLDFEAAARCRLGREVLDRHLDAHDGFLPPGRESTPLAEELKCALETGGAESHRVPGLAAQLRRDVRARLEALSRVDSIEAPTKFLAEHLKRAGLGRDVLVRPLGIERASLAAAERRSRDASEPLRVLYIGGYYEHKGVHVLLEACTGLAGQVRLELRGCAGSSSYRASLERLAERAGAQLGGPFERAELPSLLQAADLVVLPSLWPENAPFVLREAFAAGLPVIASDTAALRESVRAGVDGLLVPARDVAALRAALLRCVNEPDLLVKLARGVRAPLDIEEDASQLEARYGELAAETKRRETRRVARLPQHLHAFAERFDDLNRLPTRELFERAARGVEALAGNAVPTANVLTAILASGDRLRERLDEGRRSTGWRTEIAQDRERAVSALDARVREAETKARAERERADWMSALLQERESRLGWIEQSQKEQQARLAWKDEILAGRERTLESLRAQLELAERSLKSLRAQLELSERTREEFEGRIDQQARALQALGEERDWRAAELRGREDELAWTREVIEQRDLHLSEMERRLADEHLRARATLAELQERRRRCEDLEGELEVRAQHLRELEHALVETRAELERLADDRRAARDHEAFLESELASTGDRLAELGRELDWRCAQMRDARLEGEGFRQRLFGARLRRRLQEWGRLEPGPGEGESE